MSIEYYYELKTTKQKELINLNSYKLELENVIKKLLNDLYISITVNENKYYLQVKKELLEEKLQLKLH